MMIISDNIAKQVTRSFFAGMIISFVGSFPVGAMGAVVLMLSVSNGYQAAMWFAAGCVAVELTYVWLSLIMMGKIIKHIAMVRTFRWISFLIMVALAFNSFLPVHYQELSQAGNVLTSSALHPFVLGLVIMSLNPVQIPFWLGWTILLLSKRILKPGFTSYSSYITGIGSGSLLASCVYAFGGRFMVEQFTGNQQLINLIIGGVFTLAALLQLWGILQRRRVPGIVGESGAENSGAKSPDGVGVVTDG